jgi:hypothetical protein
MAFNQFPSKGGIPSGNTAGRPSGPVIGDTYYNGQLEILEIWNGSAWVAVSAPPATPSISSVTDVGTGLAFATGGSLNIVFTPGAGGGTPNQYNAYTTAGGFFGYNSTSTVTISGLTSGTSFVVYGNAQNNFGTTINTANAAAVTATTVPQAPTIGTATAVGNSVDVTWTLNSNGGKNLSLITITPYLNGTTAQTSQTAATTSSTTHTFTGLSFSSNYTFKVKTTNANGVSLESAATNSITTAAETLNVDFLVQAGGAGGGSVQYAGGGGGAGGMRSSVSSTGGSIGTLESIFSATRGTNYTVTVGAGSAGATLDGTSHTASNGSNSVFSTITSLGGGGGGGGSGGTGGGGNYNTTVEGGLPAGGSGTSNQGFAGGLGSGSAQDYGGGGGGTGAVGGAGSNATGGTGGAGASNSITGTATNYGGGGGGGVYSGAGVAAGQGGVGGGGRGTILSGTVGTAGTANTGGGGGGGSGSSGAYGGLAGGSGVVILRHTTSEGTITIGAGLTGTTATNGIYKVTTITAGSGNVSWA